MGIAALKPSGTEGAARSGAAMDRKIEKPKWQKHIRLIGAGVTAVVVVIGYLLFAPPSGRTLRVENTNVTISTAARGAFEDFVPIRGRITPLSTVYLDAIEGGRVEKIHVEDGATLEAGQSIVELSNTSLQLTVITSEANVTEQLN
ncbi:MAG: hypothetical protein JNM81_01095, partial [Rhodospirillaceae bacterium]|nr:hypothetical protein [Rhodospirillaceae bacterium]